MTKNQKENLNKYITNYLGKLQNPINKNNSLSKCDKYKPKNQSGMIPNSTKYISYNRINYTKN